MQEGNKEELCSIEMPQLVACQITRRKSLVAAEGPVLESKFVDLHSYAWPMGMVVSREDAVLAACSIKSSIFSPRSSRTAVADANDRE